MKQKKTKTVSETWVSTTYNLYNVFRVGNQIFKCTDPATYFKMAKDSIAMPLAQKYANETLQNVVFYSSEIVECSLSPPAYVLNKVTSVITQVSGVLVKASFELQHPELRAAIDIVGREAAHQSTNQVLKVFRGTHDAANFFRPATKHEASSQIQSSRIRSKL